MEMSSEKSRFDGYVNKGKDSENDTIVEIIAKSAEVVVYRVKGGALKFETTSDVPPAHEIELIREYDSIHRLIRKSIPRFSDQNAKRELGAALFAALSAGKAPNAGQVFADLRANVQEYGEYYAKRTYVVAGFMVLLVLIAGILCANALELDFPGPGLKYFEGAFWASIGAFTSVCIRAGRLKLDPGLATWRVAAFQGVLRLVVGGFFGVIFVAAAHADLVLGLARDIDAAMIAFSILAGFSETFVPELLERTEKASPQKPAWPPKS